MRHMIYAVALILSFVTVPVQTSAQDYESLFRDFNSSSLTQADKRFLQAALAFEGHYNGLLDGDWGALSQKAMDRYSRQEFGTSAEDWHMATLAFGFLNL